MLALEIYSAIALATGLYGFYNGRMVLPALIVGSLWPLYWLGFYIVWDGVRNDHLGFDAGKLYLEKQKRCKSQ